MDQPITFFNETADVKFNFKMTNWKKFRECITDELNANDLIPNDRNLTNTEIDFYLLKLNKYINNSIAKSVPKYTNKNSTSKYLKSTIISLQIEKTHSS